MLKNLNEYWGKGGKISQNTEDEVGEGSGIKMNESSYFDWEEARDGD